MWGNETRSAKAGRGGKEPVGANARSSKARIRLVRSSGSRSGKARLHVFRLGDGGGGGVKQQSTHEG